MTSLARIVAPLGSGCSPDDSLADIIAPLRRQYPVPLFVLTAQWSEGVGDIIGMVGLDVIIDSYAKGLDHVRVRDVMRPAPHVDLGETIEHGTIAMRRADTFGVILTKAAGGVTPLRTEPEGIVAPLQVLGIIGTNVTYKAPMKVLMGHRDLGFNVPLTPCQLSCPIGQDIATYVDYVSQGRYIDSWRVIHETNPFASILGRLCNHPCETECKRGWDPGEEPVTIRSLKRFSADAAFQQGFWIDYKIGAPKGKKVAIVGAGPSGLTAALDLRVQGYDVAIFDREARVGGLLSTSIPPFRFDRKQLEWELQMILATGIEVHCNSHVGDEPGEIHLADLLAEYDAVYVAVGMRQGRILPVPGSNAPQVTDALRFLREVAYDRMPPHFPSGGRVVVVGGGAIAADAGQAAIKLGAGEVWVVAIEPEDRLPAFGDEIHEAKEIGLNIKCGVIVKEIRTGLTGNVEAVAFAPLQALDFDEVTGKLIFSSVKEMEGAERWTVGADYVIFASGQIMVPPGDPVPLTPTGLAAADLGGHTRVDKLFAGGDCVEGASFIVDAMAWGQRAARSIREFLGEEDMEAAGNRLYQTVVERTDDHRQSESFTRTEPAILPAAKRYNLMSECELPWSSREAIVQSIRCFQCDSVHHYDDRVCILCGVCDDVCPEKAIDVVVLGEDRERSSGGDTLVCGTEVGDPDHGGVTGQIFINYDRCTNCRICEDHCPVNCITFERVRLVDDTLRVVVRTSPKLERT